MSEDDRKVLPIIVSSDGGVLAAMGEEVKACNIAKGWHDVNPRVQEFMDSLANNSTITDLNVLAEIERLAVAHFGPRTFGDDIALLHSEVSEMLEAFREDGLQEILYFKSDSGFSRLPADDPNAVRWTEAGKIGKPEGVASEAADVLVRLLDTCGRYGIDLFAAWRQKVDFNWTRPPRHGGKSM